MWNLRVENRQPVREIKKKSYALLHFSIFFRGYPIRCYPHPLKYKHTKPNEGGCIKRGRVYNDLVTENSTQVKGVPLSIFARNPSPYNAPNMDAQSTILIPPREGSERNEKKNFEKFVTRRFVRVAIFSQRFPRCSHRFPKSNRSMVNYGDLWDSVPYFTIVTPVIK